MSTVREIRTAIANRLRSIPDVGVVQEYQRYAHDMKKLAALYVAAPHGLRGWHVRRHATLEGDNIQGRTFEHIVWKLVFVMALEDAAQSELVFEDLLEAARDAFITNQTLDDTVDQCTLPGEDGESGLQIEASGPAMFGGVLSHVAHLRLNTIRYLERTP